MSRHISILIILSALALFMTSCGGGSNPVTSDGGNVIHLLGATFPPVITSLIAFSRDIPDDQNIYGMNSEIFVFNPDGLYEHQLTFDPGDDDYPAFSPSGFMLAFTSNRNSGGYGNHEIFRLGPLGNLKQLTDDAWEFNATHTMWPLPNVITAARQNMLVMAPFDVGQMYAVNPTGTWETWVPTGATMPYDPTANGVSRFITFCARPMGTTYCDDIELFLKMPGSDSYRITYFGNDSPDPLDLIYTTNPDFDSTGTKIIFQTTYWDGNTEIGMIDLSSADAIPIPMRLTGDSAEDLEPAWDSTGQWFVWVTNRDGNYEIYKQRYVDPNSDQPQPEPVRLTFTPEDEHNPEWGPIYKW